MRLSTLLALSVLPATLLPTVVTPVAAQPVRVSGAAVPFLPEGFAHARYAPGGAHVFFSTPDYNGLWVRDEATGTIRQLSAAPGVGYGVSWSPDGGALLAREADDTEDGRFFSVVTFTPDGTRTPLAAPRPGLSGLPVWAADGAAVLVPTPEGSERLVSGRVPVAAPGAAFMVGAGAEGLFRADATGRTPVAGLPAGNVLAAVPSPDGQRVAVQVMGQGLFVVEGGRVTPLGRGEAPTWSPDGRFVAFMVTADDGHDLTGSDLYAATPDGGQRFALTQTGATLEMWPAWTPDGRALLYDDVRTRRVMRLPLTVAR